MKRGVPGILLLLCLLMLFSGCSVPAQPTLLKVALPDSDKVQDVDSNYYLTWLEEQTGCTIEPRLIRQSRSGEYLDALFASETDVDVVLFGDGFTIDEETLAPYIEAGFIDTDGGREYYENTGSAARRGAGQILWINSDWLMELGLAIPATTGELRTVLRAFSENDLNGNGMKDELPLVGSCERYALSPVEYLLNSYVYNDPYHARFGCGEEREVLCAATGDFRKGLAFCNALYREGLLDARSFRYSAAQLRELVNSPEALVGAFTTASISDVIYQVNPEIMARYMHVPPLEGPEGVRHALYTEEAPTIGGIITARSQHKEEARRLLETMLTEEASLIARYGEESVDWEYSDGRDVSVYGGPSTIVTKNYIWNSPQNKHLNGIGPMDVPERYLTGVTWNGLNSDAEYIDGRAQMSYLDALPRDLRFHEAIPGLSACVDEAVEAFVTGKRDIGSDREWEVYLEELAQFY